MIKNGVDFKNYLENYPDKNGYFGKYGGSYASEELNKAFKEIDEAYEKISKTEEFKKELKAIREDFQGRPTPVYYAERLSKIIGGANIYLKREDLNHTGAHKLNHCMGEVLLAKHMGKTKVIAETGAGMHGVAMATAAAYFGLECEIHMGTVDIVKQAPNVKKMKVLGAKIVEVTRGNRTLKEAVDSAFESYLKDTKNSMYCIGSVVGPNPFPKIVRDFQLVVGNEAREQMLKKTGSLPNTVVACVGGGSNSIGIFIPFINDDVEIIGVEPLGKGKNIGENAASINFGKEGVMHGFNSLMLEENGEPAPVYSVASGLDYPASGPEHAFLHDLNRVKYELINDREALDAFFMLSRSEGIVPAIESAHAVAYAMKKAKEMKEGTILVNLSGRGDKDLEYILEKYGKEYNI